jgi:hypothetical protein
MGGPRFAAVLLEIPLSLSALGWSDPFSSNQIAARCSVPVEWIA